MSNTSELPEEMQNFRLWGMLTDFLARTDSVLAIHGSLIAGILALMAGAGTIFIIHRQIQSENDARLEQRIAAGKAYIAAYKEYIRNVGNAIAKIRDANPERDGMRPVNADIRRGLINEIQTEPPNLLYDWQYFSMLPSLTIDKFINVRDNVKLIRLQCSKSVKRRPGTNIIYATWNTHASKAEEIIANTNGLVAEIEAAHSAAL